MGETDVEAMARVVHGTRKRRLALALAYEVWHYDGPNDAAVVQAEAHIERVFDAAAAAGLVIRLHEAD